MMRTRLRLALLGSLILAGCGTQGLPGLNGSLPAGSDPQTYAIQALQADLSAMVRADANGVQVATGTAAATPGVATSLTVGSQVSTTTTVANVPYGNAAIAAALDLQAPHANVDTQASSVLDERYFAVKNCFDGNLHSAWAPALNDEHPSLTLDLAAATDVEALALKMSGDGVLVDVAASLDGATWTTVASDLAVTLHTLDRLDLKARNCRYVRVSFHGGQVHRLLVCELHAFGRPASVQPSARPSLRPSAAPSLRPSAVPSVAPSAMPSASPTVKPSAAASQTPAAMPSSKPSAGPGVRS